MTASNLKKTPLNQWHREHGAKMVDFGGWDMPVQYETGILQEHLATRRFGGLFDVSHMGRFRRYIFGLRLAREGRKIADLQRGNCPL